MKSNMITNAELLNDDRTDQLIQFTWNTDRQGDILLTYNNLSTCYDLLPVPNIVIIFVSSYNILSAVIFILKLLGM